MAKPTLAECLDRVADILLAEELRIAEEGAAAERLASAA